MIKKKNTIFFDIAADFLKDFKVRVLKVLKVAAALVLCYRTATFGC